MMKSLIGHIIQKIEIDDDGERMIITTDSRRFTYAAAGDCCAVAYLILPTLDDIQTVIKQKVIAVDVRDFRRTDKGLCDVTDTEFYSIQTHNGDLDLELRTDHNGYYGGWLELTETEECWPIFDEIREEAQAEM
jgi:hypothetical protein